MHTGFVALARPGYVIPVPVTTPPLTRLTGPQCAPLPPESPAPSTSVAVGPPPVPDVCVANGDGSGSMRWSALPCDLSTGALIDTTTTTVAAGLTEAERCELDPECFRLPTTGSGSRIVFILGVFFVSFGVIALFLARRRA